MATETWCPWEQDGTGDRRWQASIAGFTHVNGYIALSGTPILLPQDEAGRVILPFTMKGTVTAPRIVLNEKSLIEQAKEEVVNEVRKQIGSKIESLLIKPSSVDQCSQESDKVDQEPGDQPKR